MNIKQVATPVTQETIKPAEYLNSGIAEGVVVPLLQNIAGGTGVAVFITTLLAVASPETEFVDVMRAVPLAPGAVAGLLVASAATFVRAFRDEVSFLVGRWAEHHDEKRAAILQAKIDEQAKLLEEYKNKGAVSNRYAIQVAAEKLLDWHFNKKIKISRSECMKRGMTRPDWEHALKALQNAGIADGNGKVIDEDGAIAWRKFVRHLGTSREWVRTKDDDLAQV